MCLPCVNRSPSLAHTARVATSAPSCGLSECGRGQHLAQAGGRPLVDDQDPGRLQVPHPLQVAGLGLAGPGVDTADAPLAVDGVLAADLGRAPPGRPARRGLGPPVAVLGAALDPGARVPDLLRVEGGELAGDGDLAGAEQQEPGAVDPAGPAPAAPPRAAPPP